VLPSRLNQALVLLIAAGLVAPALAQQPAADQQYEAPPMSQMQGPQLTPAQLDQIRAVTELVKSKAAAAAADPTIQAAAQQMVRRIDDLANKESAGERDKVLRFMKIDPKSQNGLYIFVTWGMPLDMLRAYALEAMWTGGFLVFRGLPPGRTITDFFMKDLHQIIYDKGASAAVSIDPRLFDLYSVSVAPTIVFTTDRSNPVCADSGTHDVKAKDEKGKAVIVPYELCPKMDPAKYWKMAGAVTVDYALSAFQSSGATQVAPLLQSLQRGYQGDSASKDQKPFTGVWKDAPSPNQKYEEEDKAKTP
jgi:type-F conjugative transfer system pilin assembly protein TrbC